MTIATMTSKGQVVIPIDIRKKLNLHTGDKLDFNFDSKNKTLYANPISKSVDDVFGILKSKTTKSFTAEEMNSELEAAFKAKKI